MPGTTTRVLLEYAVAAASASMAVAATRTLLPFMPGTVTPFLLLAVLVSSYVGGRGPGLVAVALGAIGALLVLEPRLAFQSGPLSTFLRLAAFVVVGVAIAELSGARRAALRREREARLEAEAQRALIEGVIEGTSDAIFAKDLAGRYVLWNPASEVLNGRRAAEALGRTDADLFPDDVARRLRDEDRRVIEIGEPAVFDLDFALAGGAAAHPKRLVIAKSPWRGPDGRLLGVIGVGRDVTERARVEEERARALEEQRAAVRLRDEFISIASHELKTPLSSLQLLVQHFERTGVPRADAAMRQVRRLLKLIDDLLDVSKIRAGRFQFTIEDVDLAELAREVAARFSPEFEQAACRLECRADAPVIGRWDRARLEQVLTNLLSNALKYGCAERDRPVELEVGAENGRARVVVRDEGIGIDLERQPHIFGPFERAVPAGSTTTGAGLGLWITREIVGALGGSIRVESAPKRGAKFIVELPRRVESSKSKVEN